MTDKKIVLCDADDTIENLCETWVNYLNNQYGTKVLAENVVDWDVSKFFPELTKDQVYAPIYDATCKVMHGDISNGLFILYIIFLSFIEIIK